MDEEMLNAEGRILEDDEGIDDVLNYINSRFNLGLSQLEEIMLWRLELLISVEIRLSNLISLMRSLNKTTDALNNDDELLG
jgi:hypothetical protein